MASPSADGVEAGAETYCDGIVAVNEAAERARERERKLGQQRERTSEVASPAVHARHTSRASPGARFRLVRLHCPHLNSVRANRGEGDACRRCSLRSAHHLALAHTSYAAGTRFEGLRGVAKNLEGCPTHTESHRRRRRRPAPPRLAAASYRARPGPTILLHAQAGQGRHPAPLTALSALRAVVACAPAGFSSSPQEPG